MGAYQDYITSLTPNHYWIMQSDSADSGFGSVTTTLNPTNANVTYDGTPLTKGATTSAKFSGGYLDFGDAADVNVTGNPWFRRSYSMWATADDFNTNLMLYSEGGGSRNMTFMFALGGTVQYIADNDADSQAGCPWSQAVNSPKVKTGTPYHMGYVWESDRGDTGQEGKNRSYLRCFLNGRFIGEKEIYKWDTTNNEEILTEPGGQLNGHSGNIVLGQGRKIVVSKKQFSPSSHRGEMSDVAMWDGVILTDEQMWQLFSRGATPTTAIVTFTDLPIGSELRLFDSQSPYNEIGTGVETSVSTTVSIDYTVSDEASVRLVIISPNKQVFSKIVTLPREDSIINAGLLLLQDRNYRNP